MANFLISIQGSELGLIIKSQTKVNALWHKENVEPRPQFLLTVHKMLILFCLIKHLKWFIQDNLIIFLFIFAPRHSSALPSLARYEAMLCSEPLSPWPEEA